jgi:hypothetical protein
MRRETFDFKCSADSHPLNSDPADRRITSSLKLDISGMLGSGNRKFRNLGESPDSEVKNNLSKTIAGVHNSKLKGIQAHKINKSSNLMVGQHLICHQKSKLVENESALNRSPASGINTSIRKKQVLIPRSGVSPSLISVHKVGGTGDKNSGTAGLDTTASFKSMDRFSDFTPLPSQIPFSPVPCMLKSSAEKSGSGAVENPPSEPHVLSQNPIQARLASNIQAHRNNAKGLYKRIPCSSEFGADSGTPTALNIAGARLSCLIEEQASVTSQTFDDPHWQSPHRHKRTITPLSNHSSKKLCLSAEGEHGPPRIHSLNALSRRDEEKKVESAFERSAICYTSTRFDVLNLLSI